jgi:hypothetical protein
LSDIEEFLNRPNEILKDLELKSASEMYTYEPMTPLPTVQWRLLTPAQRGIHRRWRLRMAYGRLRDVLAMPFYWLANFISGDDR